MGSVRPLHLHGCTGHHLGWLSGPRLRVVIN
jgi:hypothetical protein